MHDALPGALLGKWRPFELIASPTAAPSGEKKTFAIAVLKL